MAALLTGFVLILAAVWTMLPGSAFGLGWAQDVLVFLKGGAPIIAILVGILAVFIGIADLKDKKQAAQEKAEADKETSGEEADQKSE